MPDIWKVDVSRTYVQNGKSAVSCEVGFREIGPGIGDYYVQFIVLSPLAHQRY
jgi:hypothetical protein